MTLEIAEEAGSYFLYGDGKRVELGDRSGYADRYPVICDLNNHSCGISVESDSMTFDWTLDEQGGRLTGILELVVDFTCYRSFYQNV
jgi:hypothetical protein